MDQRSYELLKVLHVSEQPLSVSVLASRFSISRRAVYHDLDKVNEWLRDQHLSPVVHLRGVGYGLDEQTKTALQGLSPASTVTYILSPEERVSCMVFLLLCAAESVHVEDLAKSLEVSRNTVLEDLHEVRSLFAKYELEVVSVRGRGYVVEGEESKQRRLLFSILPPDFNAVDRVPWLLLAIRAAKFSSVQKDSKLITQLLTEAEREYGARFADEALSQLALKIVLVSRRIQQGAGIHLSEEEIAILSQTKAFQSAKQVCTKLPDILGSTFSHGETAFITQLILSTKVETVKVEDEDQPLKWVIRKMVQEFQMYACIVFSNQESLEHQLLVHLKPCLQRVRFGLEEEVPLTEHIQEKYRDIFQLTKRVIPVFENLAGRSVSDSEIALIALHFGGWLRKDEVQLTKRKRMMIVCIHGVGTSQFLKSKLEHVFTDIDIVEVVSKRQFERREHLNVDVIVTTVPLPKQDVPTFYVDPIIKDDQVEQIFRTMYPGGKPSTVTESAVDALMHQLESYAMVKDRARFRQVLQEWATSQQGTPVIHRAKRDLFSLLTEDVVQKLPSAENWQQAIQLAAEPLVQKEMISESYVEAMIDHVTTHGPYIVLSPGVAFPHGKPEEGVRELGFSLLLLDESVAFSEKEKHQVRCLVVLAPVDQEAHLHAIGQLRDVFKEGIPDQWIQAQSREELYAYIQQSVSKS